MVRTDVTGHDDDLLGELCHFYGSRRRRALLSALAEFDDHQDDPTVVEYDELAAATVAHEEACSRDDVPKQKLRSAKSGLRQNHLPLLESYGLIDWDDRSGAVRIYEHFDGFLELLATLHEVAVDADIPDITKRRRSRW